MQSFEGSHFLDHVVIRVIVLSDRQRYIRAGRSLDGNVDVIDHMILPIHVADIDRIRKEDFGSPGSVCLPGQFPFAVFFCNADIILRV